MRRTVTVVRDIAPAIQPPNAIAQRSSITIVAAVTAGQCSTGGAAAGQLALLLESAISLSVNGRALVIQKSFRRRTVPFPGGWSGLKRHSGI